MLDTVLLGDPSELSDEVLEQREVELQRRLGKFDTDDPEAETHLRDLSKLRMFQFERDLDPRILAKMITDFWGTQPTWEVIVSILVEGERILNTDIKQRHPADLYLLIGFHQLAMDYEGAESFEKAFGYVGIARCFEQRFLKGFPNLRDHRDIKEVSRYRELAIGSFRDDYTKKDLFLRLGHIYFSIYRTTKEVEYLDQAISDYSKALRGAETLSEVDYQELSTINHDLCVALVARCKLSKSVGPLNEAENVLRPALVSPFEDTKTRGRLLLLYALVLKTRYELNHEYSTLELCIQKANESYQLAMSIGDDLDSSTSMLKRLYEIKYSRSGKDEDLERLSHFMQYQVEEEKAAVEMVSKGRVMFKNCFRSRDSSGMAKAKETMEMGRRLLKTNHPAGNPKGYISQAYSVSSATDFVLKFESARAKGGSVSDIETPDLDKAIEHKEAALEAEPETSSSWAAAAIRAAYLHAIRNEIIQGGQTEQSRQEHAKRAMELCSQVMEHPKATPTTRLQATLSAVMTDPTNESYWPWKDQMANSAMEDLPLVCSREMTRQDQEDVLHSIAGFAAHICSLSIRLGNLEEAVQRLEYGRGLIFGHLIDRSDDLEDLKKEHPSLAQKYEELRDLSFEEIGNYDGTDDWETMRMDQIQARAALQECEAEIRDLTDFEYFQKPAPFKDLQRQAAYGPIVIVNVTHISSDAIIITESQLDTIHLPDLLMIPGALHDVLEAARTSERSDRDVEKEDNCDTSMPEILHLLWETCVLPVVIRLAELGIYPDPSDPPRVWWIGSGHAASLPFHAAVDMDSLSLSLADPHYGCPQAFSCLGWMTPSYTTSIRALRYARQRTAQLDLDKEPKVMVVVMPTTPGLPDLEGVMEERRAIIAAARSFRVDSSLESPSADEVLKCLHNSSVVHFACHGMSNTRYPLASHIVLRKKNENGELVADGLNVGSILDVTSKMGSSSWLAYLSACGTAKLTRYLKEENIHLASAFQIAGFPHAVGSLWSAQDSACAELAELFYGELSTYSGDNRKFSVARALHKAVERMRDEHLLYPEYWVPFIHFGA